MILFLATEKLDGSPENWVCVSFIYGTPGIGAMSNYAGWKGRTVFQDIAGIIDTLLRGGIVNGTVIYALILVWVENNFFDTVWVAWVLYAVENDRCYITLHPIGEPAAAGFRIRHPGQPIQVFLGG